MEPAKNDVKNQLKLLNKHLLTKTFLVGERITLADVAVGVTLLPLYQHVLEQSLRDEYQNVTRYFLTLINQKNFADVIGKVELCSGVKRLTAGQPSHKYLSNLKLIVFFLQKASVKAKNRPRKKIRRNPRRRNSNPLKNQNPNQWMMVVMMMI